MEHSLFCSCRCLDPILLCLLEELSIQDTLLVIFLIRPCCREASFWIIHEPRIECVYKRHLAGRTDLKLHGLISLFPVNPAQGKCSCSAAKDEGILVVYFSLVRHTNLEHKQLWLIMKLFFCNKWLQEARERRHNSLHSENPTLLIHAGVHSLRIWALHCMDSSSCLINIWSPMCLMYFWCDSMENQKRVSQWSKLHELKLVYRNEMWVKCQ